MRMMVMLLDLIIVRIDKIRPGSSIIKQYLRDRHLSLGLVDTVEQYEPEGIHLTSPGTHRVNEIKKWLSCLDTTSAFALSEPWSKEVVQDQHIGLYMDLCGLEMNIRRDNGRMREVIGGIWAVEFTNFLFAQVLGGGVIWSTEFHHGILQRTERAGLW